MKGQNLRIFVGEKCFAKATSCTIHVQADTESSSTKDDTGDWASNEVVGKSWDFQVDSLVVVDADATGKTAVDAIGLIGTVVSAKFDITTGTNNRGATNSTIKHSGKAIIQDFSLNAPNRQNATYSLKGVGTGPLE